MAPEKLDFFKVFKAEYQAGARPALVQTGKAHYLQLAGRGAPGGEAFQEAVGVLYAMAFTIKMGRKKDGRGDYAIGKLEARYRASGAQEAIAPEDWSWELLIRTPREVAGFPLDASDLETARDKLRARGKGAGTEAVVLSEIDAGCCVQMLHVGPYTEEERTLELMRDFMRAEALQPAGEHHEIYISDPRRVPPERLKTILRLPVKPAC